MHRSVLLHWYSSTLLSTHTMEKQESMLEIVEGLQDYPGGAVIPALSVVVIGRNEGARLAECLGSVGKARGVEVREIIYVDSASTDGSPELASQYGAVVIVVRSE